MSLTALTALTGRAETSQLLQLRAVTAGAGVGLTLLLGACGGSTPSSSAAVAPPTVAEAAASVPPVDLPTDLLVSPGTALPPGTAAPQVTAGASATAGVEALKGTVVPAGFPFPKGATPTVSVSKPQRATISLSGVTPSAAVQFYRQALPAAGYKYLQQGGSDGRTKLTFEGKGQNIELLAGGSGSPDLVLLLFANL